MESGWAALCEEAKELEQANRNFIRSQGGPTAAPLAALDALQQALCSAAWPRVGQLRALAAAFLRAPGLSDAHTG